MQIKNRGRQRNKMRPWEIRFLKNAQNRSELKRTTKQKRTDEKISTIERIKNFHVLGNIFQHQGNIAH